MKFGISCTRLSENWLPMLKLCNGDGLGLRGCLSARGEVRRFHALNIHTRGSFEHCYLKKSKRNTLR